MGVTSGALHRPHAGHSWPRNTGRAGHTRAPKRPASCPTSAPPEGPARSSTGPVLRRGSSRFSKNLATLPAAPCSTTTKPWKKPATRNVHDALFEDLGRQRLDRPAGAHRPHGCTPASRCARTAVLCGREWFDACMARARRPPPRVRVALRRRRRHGRPTRRSARSEADARALLSAERPALNFLQLLSATATVTRAHAQGHRGRSRPTRAAAWCSTPARPCPACARRRNTRCAWAAATTSGWRCGTAS